MRSPQAVQRRATGMLSSPLRGERRAFDAVRKEESVQHTPQSVERRSSGIRRSPPKV